MRPGMLSTEVAPRRRHATVSTTRCCIRYATNTVLVPEELLGLSLHLHEYCPLSGKFKRTVVCRAVRTSVQSMCVTRRDTLLILCHGCGHDYVGEVLVEMSLVDGRIIRQLPGRWARNGIDTHCNEKFIAVARIRCVTTALFATGEHLATFDPAPTTGWLPSSVPVCIQVLGDNTIAVLDGQTTRLYLMTLYGEVIRILPLQEHVFRMQQSDTGEVLYLGSDYALYSTMGFGGPPLPVAFDAGDQPLTVSCHEYHCVVVGTPTGILVCGTQHLRLCWLRLCGCFI